MQASEWEWLRLIYGRGLTKKANSANLSPTMESTPETKSYELAYHLTPDIEESEARNRVQELNDIITTSGGSVLVAKEPRKIHLSYSVKSKNYAYFGIMDFQAASDSIDKINNQMKLQNSILRYLLVKKPEFKEVRTLGEYRARARVKKTYEPAPTEARKSAPKEKTAEEKAQLDEELAKVIEGL
jgi:small subunit ribosomal protein S6